MAGAVRQPIDLPSLERYIDQNVPALKTPLDIKQLTTADGKKVVLRKKPPGKLLSKTAHRVEREYQIIKALGGTDIPVPEEFCLCEDNNVIGTPFYIMEFLDGRHFTDPAMPGVSAEERNALWKNAVQTLAKFHSVVPSSVGLEGFGKPTNFFDRQIATFNTISKAQAAVVDADTKEPVGELPYFDEMVQFFAQKSTQPRDRGTLVHGDYKIDNMIFHQTEPRVIGILDWEMATVGHPLCRTFAISATGRVPGLPTRGGCMREVAGYNPAEDVLWGDAFFAFRGSVIMQGIAARFAGRQASSARAGEYAKRAKPFALGAWERVQRVQRQSQKGKL
ncbi:hypothetical protein N7494_005118 [Penicillium frequentans]|uniref:Aminoglycoside phosphotransferase domain-containing protein n=1 Tax=Penicillium frequentans TaxID=3151616 RepID=A0AAD6CZS6_9EURO|nr:hypothetical protein N7494_005118 [Penicillium glabrum]